MRFGTESGTEYEVSGQRIRRVVAGDAEAMRRDGEWLDLLAAPHVVIGYPAIFALEPLGEGNVTIRTTSDVTFVLDTQPEGDVHECTHQDLVERYDEGHGVVTCAGCGRAFPSGDIA